MKYKVTTTTADHVNGHEYNSARAALTAYNNIREIYARAGYTIADAGTGHNSRAELWIKEGRADRNIEIWPVTDEPTAAPAAGSLTAKVATAARVFLLACCLSAADTLTAAAIVDRDSLTAPAVVISESESADTTTARPLLTADELAELLALLTGTTTAESEPTAAPAADDSQDTPAEVISEPTESEPTAAPADGHQDTPATTGTTTPAAPSAGCPAAVATPCPPAAPVAPVAPIIL